MKAKSIIKNLCVAGIMTVAVMGAAHAVADESKLCELIGELQRVFKILRILAFVGAGFIMASWAWDFINGNSGKDDAGVMETLKKKGISMLVGVALLFAVGVLLSFLIGGETMGCKSVLTGGWR